MKKIVSLLLLLLATNIFANDELTIVAVGEAQVVKDKVLLEAASFSDDSLTRDKLIYDTHLKVIENDLNFYQELFDIMMRNESSTGSVSFNKYTSTGVNYLVRSGLVKEANQTALNLSVFNIAKQEEIFSKSYPFSKERAFAHQIANGIYQAIVGKPSIFNDKVVFVSNKNSKKGNKELFIMDFDGANRKQLTFHGGVVLSPAVSHNGKKILYSLIDETRGRKKNVSLRIYDLETKKSRVVSSRPGINSGAIFSETSDEIILTLSSVHGNAELYRMNLNSKKIERLTRSLTPDVDPSLNMDGSILTFLSGRPGSPMIYLMDPSGLEKNVKRIGFVGKFNGTPRFSPDGREIAFSAWLDNRFDLFRLNSDGTGLGRLTKDFGSNEEPDYSKDGQFIVFTSQRVISQRQADQNLYIMDREGKILGPITKDFGNCKSPRWLKSL